MLILPAIDLLGGNVGAPVQGQARVGQGLLERAGGRSRAASCAPGATRVHVVDLDAAFGDGDNRAVHRADRRRRAPRCRRAAACAIWPPRARSSTPARAPSCSAPAPSSSPTLVESLCASCRAASSSPSTRTAARSRSKAGPRRPTSTPPIWRRAPSSGARPRSCTPTSRATAPASGPTSRRRRGWRACSIRRR